VQHATAEQLAELRQMVNDERDSFSRGDRGAGIRLSGEFHLKLAEAAKNAPLISFQRSLVSQTSLIIAQYESGNRSHCSYDEHSQLIDAIEARDAALAVNLMMHHMDHIDSKLNLDEESASDDCMRCSRICCRARSRGVRRSNSKPLPHLGLWHI